MKLRNWQTPFVASLAATSSAEKGCTVHLQDYGSFSGTTINETYSGHALPQAVDAWLGMDYASQPVGHRRFTPSSWPSPFNGTKYATSYGKACIQELSSSLPLELQDEACLNFNVYRTPGVPLEQKLPVLVWIHGGSFYAGSYKSFDGASFAASSPAPIVVVNFHYRVNSFGRSHRGFLMKRDFPTSISEISGCSLSLFRNTSTPLVATLRMSLLEVVRLEATLSVSTTSTTTVPMQIRSLCLRGRFTSLAQ
jgi:hypothetical protein